METYNFNEMKRFIILLLIISTTLLSVAQSKKKGKVKRKYRQAETVSENLPPVFLRGKVRNQAKELLIGASVRIIGSAKGVNTNEDGEYFFYGLETGRVRIQASFIGYQTKYTDYYIQDGENDMNFMLDEDNVKIDPITVTSQKREQQILDVPLAVTSIDAVKMEKLALTDLGYLSEFVPGLMIREQGANRPSFVIRGLSSDEVSPSAQPRISVFYNNVPISRASGASVELFDLEQVEVSKGPQGTLFGRGAQIGAIHFVSKKPTNNFNGAITAGLGDYGQQELRGALNAPLIDNKVFIRIAGIYNKRDGYVENTLGGTLNGKNTIAGRFSLRILPMFNKKIDLTINYQKDDNPGVAFMSQLFPNTNGETNIFNYSASLDKGEELFNGKEIFDATLNMKHYYHEHSYWTSISSFRKTDASSRFDGDGTAATAIDISEKAKAWQLYQELRLNFSKGSRLNGFIGGNYWREHAEQTYGFAPNEQHLFHLFFNPAGLILPNGQPYSVPGLPPLPELGQLGGMPLTTSHIEENYSSAINQSAEVFADATYQLTPKISFTGGVRVSYEKFKLKYSSEMVGDSPATLGMLTGNYPNILFAVAPENEIKNNSLAFTYRGGLKYKFNENANIYASYSKGRRPTVLQFTATGEPETLEAESVKSYDLGIKTVIRRQVYADVSLFYYNYNNFQTSAWIADSETGEFNYKVVDGGKASSYGAEVSLKAAIITGVELFGNYAYIHARFDSTDSNGYTQEYADNRFKLTPDHSFSVGVNLSANLTEKIKIFATPSYSYKTKLFFEDANTEGLEQEAYGTVNATCGISFAEPNIQLSFYGTNLLEEKYIVSAGNAGSLFGIPTFIPGAPRMFGTKLTWKF